MGVDHGLGGKDNLKSKTRREQKAKRLKNLTKSLRTEGLHNRNEVKFDEAARVAFITGFRKRKLERRKYGIAMQLLKDKKQRKEANKEKVKILMENNQEVLDQIDSESEPNTEEAEGSSHILVQNTFDDDATRNMFGSSVSVVVSDDIKDKNEEYFNLHEEDNEDGDEDGDDDDRSRTSYRSIQSSHSHTSKQKGKRREQTPFERAIKKAKQLIGNKKKKSHVDRSQHLNHKQQKQIKSSKLLTKAFNSQKLKMKR